VVRQMNEHFKTGLNRFRNLLQTGSTWISQKFNTFPPGQFLATLGGIALVGLLWAFLRWLMSSTRLPVELKLVFLISTALLCLLAGLVGLSIFLRRHGRPQISVLPAGVVLALAYLVPALTFLLPDWLNLLRGGQAPQASLISFSGASSLTAGQPWFFIWQALVLTGYALSRQWVRGRQLAARPAAASAKTIPIPAFIPPVWPVLAGLLSGLGLWLAGAFLFSLLVPAANRQVLPVLPALHATTLIIALTIAPYAEESFFRGELFNRWQARLGNPLTTLLTASLYGLLQVHPARGLPAFLLGLGLAALTRRTRHLLPAILAHAVYNALSFLFGWYLVI